MLFLLPHKIMGPQILQGFLTILGLKLYYEFCLRRMGAKVGRLAYYFMLMNWFTSYCAARTITNQTEMSLNMICLYLLNSGMSRSNVVSLKKCCIASFLIDCVCMQGNMYFSLLYWCATSTFDQHLPFSGSRFYPNF